jgi:hypothetical protein
VHIHIIIERTEEKPWPWPEGSEPGGEEVEMGGAHLGGAGSCAAEAPSELPGNKK